MDGIDAAVEARGDHVAAGAAGEGVLSGAAVEGIVFFEQAILINSRVIRRNFILVFISRDLVPHPILMSLIKYRIKGGKYSNNNS